MQKLLWMDLEMTGLDEKVHHIVEIAALVSDLNFESLEAVDSVVFQPPEIINLMDEWCKKTHGASGLTKQIPNGRRLEEVESEILAMIERHYPRNERVVIAGNSIHQDRRFIEKYMLRLEKRLHYRMVDVSSFKQIFRDKWGIKIEKRNCHRAVDDIHESVAELKAYLNYVHIN